MLDTRAWLLLIALNFALLGFAGLTLWAVVRAWEALW